MSYMKEPKGSKYDRDPSATSPLSAAISAQDRDTLAMVASALKDRRMRLAFQPVVYAADPTLIGFFEGFIRLLNLPIHILICHRPTLWPHARLHRISHQVYALRKRSTTFFTF